MSHANDKLIDDLYKQLEELDLKLVLVTTQRDAALDACQTLVDKHGRRTWIGKDGRNQCVICGWIANPNDEKQHIDSCPLLKSEKALELTPERAKKGKPK